MAPAKPRRHLAIDDAIATVRAAALSVTAEAVPLKKALGRVLASPVIASRDQPPFRASAMDGYAVRHADLSACALKVIGESTAGRRFAGPVGQGEAVRIFTGAPLPDDCDAVIVQERVKISDDHIEILPDDGPDDRKVKDAHIRAAGQDFRACDRLLEAGIRLDPWRLSLASSAGLYEIMAAQRPGIALLCTGDELVAPGNDPNADQIYESASAALMALIRQWGGKAHALGIEGDSEKAIYKALKAANADLIVTVGGASVGEYDLVKPALKRLGLSLEFETLNLKPGKPTAFGRLKDGRHVLGLPGNPASAFVVAQLLLKPWIEASLGITESSPFVQAVLTHALGSTGPRETYMRARLECSERGQLRVTPFSDQDSSLVSVFAQADALMRRPAGGQALKSGSVVDIIPLDRY